MAELSLIRVRGARTHNLADVDVDLPRNALVVITGPSGSGKSSLAFDTIFAEGQRRYVESLSVSARQFLAQLPKPDADLIEGLSPSVALEQSSVSRNPRSTVGTSTEIYDFLRLLFARVGEVFSMRTGLPMQRHSVEQMVDAAEALPHGTRISVIAPVARARAGDLSELLDDLRRQGFLRIAIDDEVRDLSDPWTVDPDRRHDVDVYVDRLAMKDGIRGRLADSLEAALRLSGGVAEILPIGAERMSFHTHHAEIEHGLHYPELTPGLFSFNTPEGACPGCDGLGRRFVVDPERVIPDPSVSIKDGALRPLSLRGSAGLRRALEQAAETTGVDLFAPWNTLTIEQQIGLLQGTGELAVGLPFEGLIPSIERRLRELEQKAADSDEDPGGLDDLAAFLAEETCSECGGERLRAEARHVKIAGLGIHALAAMPLTKLLTWIGHLDLDSERNEIARVILAQALARLRCLVDLGLGYLTLDRTSVSLSGGESQRARLATQVGCSLLGVTYVLDEPSIGLHPRDNDRLIATLRRLRDIGNTVIVVEHDLDTIRAADYLVDMGPGAGERGGRITAQGTLADLMLSPRSLTGGYLSGRNRIPLPVRRRSSTRSISIRGASGNNLIDLSVRIPMGVMTCVTGVSGSGKLTLIIDTLLPEAKRRISGSATRGLRHERIDGLEFLDRVISVDQSPIGRSPRSNPATYTGIFAELRTLYAGLNEAKLRGFAASRFSFNVRGGRCEGCQGEGTKRIEMHFLPDHFVTCAVCRGRRYDRETLAIRYRGLSIADALESSVDQACEFFANHASIRQKLEILRDVGLGYMQLGQSALTLSGGEAQRIKLAKELARKSTGSTLFVLDEPTTGLHVHDVRVLLRVLDRLVDDGNTVIVIEHDLDVIKCADYVIDIGPDGGDEGGRLVAAGTPEHVAKSDGATAKWLAPVLASGR